MININVEEVCALYNSGLSLREVSKLFDVSFKPIMRILKNNNVARRQSAYTLDECYFNNIDTPEKAYILGLLYADGGLREDAYSISITLQEKDKDILDKINKLLGSDRVLYFTPKPNEKCQNYYTLCICNKQMCSDLIKHGVTQNKTFLLRLPQIDNKLFFDFIRGYFDGDGYVYFDKRRAKTGSWGIVSNKIFCEDIKRHLDTLNINSRIYIHSTRNPLSAELRIGKCSELEKIFSLMYNNSTIHFDRKYNKFSDFLSRTK
jgi:intein-encoded DNA endonuclease-like protein